jgi:hypothetical protein
MWRHAGTAGHAVHTDAALHVSVVENSLRASSIVL